MDNIRDYGLGDSTPNVRGKPRLREKLDEACPHCGCQGVFSIEIDVEHPNLRGETGIGLYVGCAACPWASPMLMRSALVTKEES